MKYFLQPPLTVQSIDVSEHSNFKMLLFNFFEHVVALMTIQIEIDISTVLSDFIAFACDDQHVPDAYNDGIYIIFLKNDVRLMSACPALSFLKNKSSLDGDKHITFIDYVSSYILSPNPNKFAVVGDICSIKQ